MSPVVINVSSRDLAENVTSRKLTHEQTARAVRKRKGRVAQKSTGTKQTFITSESWKVTVSASKKGTYWEIEEALTYALEEVRHRIKNNTRLF